MAQPPPPYPGEFIRGVVGSTIHGLSVADTDDLDLMGVCVPPAQEVLRMGVPFEQHTFRTQPEGHPSGPGDVDLTCYSLHKYLGLAAKGNPTIINLLFVPTYHCHIDTPLAAELRDQIPWIISKEAGPRYLGYMKSQRERLLGLRGQKHTGGHRQRYYTDVYGFDTKYAMHLCRLGIQGIEVMTEGHVTFPVPEPHRSDLMEIRSGQWPLDKVTRYAESIEEDLKRAIDHSTLPDHPDRDHLNHWLRHTYLETWAVGALKSRTWT